LRIAVRAAAELRLRKVSTTRRCSSAQGLAPSRRASANMCALSGARSRRLHSIWTTVLIALLPGRPCDSEVELSIGGQRVGARQVAPRHVGERAVQAV
jgi:hypothetical protein